ncbi:MAG: hypothetical protein M3O29_04330 [Actinomycetota bacterium]|nr:hypothetical protein [Actinomycetota bacterium]
MSAVTMEVTAFQYRSIGAARRRVAVARERANRFNTEENRLAVMELEAGLARMEGKK